MPLTFRPFRNSDPPALARLWNQRPAAPGVICPARVHELDGHAWSGVTFDPRGLIVAEIEGKIVGFVHAGFGPEDPIAEPLPLELNRELGTITQLIVAPGSQAREIAEQLVRQAEVYLRKRGARVIYAGALYPLNPFYWGLAGGSEGSGVTSSEQLFHETLAHLGYDPVSTTFLMEADLLQPEPRDPRAVILKRMTQVEFTEDAMPSSWWDGLALDELQLIRAELALKTSGLVVARAEVWDMGLFGRADGRARAGLMKLEVIPAERKKGYGRHLVREIIHRLQASGVTILSAQTSSSNEAALALYRSLGFDVIDQSTLYRLPADRLDRTDQPAQ